MPEIPDKADVIEEKSINGITHSVFYKIGDDYKIWYGFSEKQLEVRDDYINGDNDIVEIQADTRSGKSVLASRLIVSLAWAYDDTEWGVVGDGYTDADRSTYKVLREQIPDCPQDAIESSPIVEYYNKTKNRIKLKNGSMIYLASSESPTAFKGSELNGVWCDETYFYKDIYKTLRVCFQRMSAEPRFGVISTTSLEAENEHYEIFTERVNPKTDEAIGWNISIHTMGIDDNPFLSEDIKDGLKRSGNLGSEYFTTEGRVYDRFKRSVHVVDVSDLKIDSDWRVYGLDFGWDDPLVVLEIGQTSNGQFVVLDEYYKSEKSLEDAVDWIDRRPSGTVYADWNPRQQERMRKKLSGHRIENAYKDINDGIEQVRNRLSADGRDNIGLLFSDDLRETLKEIRGYTESEVGSSTAKDHAMDCLRYAVASPRDSSSSSGGSGAYYVGGSGDLDEFEEKSDVGIGSIDDYVGE